MIFRRFLAQRILEYENLNFYEFNFESETFANKNQQLIIYN